MAWALLAVPQLRRRAADHMQAQHEELEAASGVAVLGTRRNRTSADIPSVSGNRPVMLVTFDVPFEPEATELAVDAAVESGQRLIIVNAAEVPLGPISLAMKYEYIGTQEVEDALQAPAALAVSLAVEVERLRLCSPRPIEALLELVAERAPGLLVVGPDRDAAQAAHLREADEADPRARGLPRLAACLSSAARLKPHRQTQLARR